MLALEDITQLLFKWLINVFIFLIERTGGFYCSCLNLDSFKSFFQNFFHHSWVEGYLVIFFLIMSYLTLIEIHLHILKFFKKEVLLSLLYSWGSQWRLHCNPIMLCWMLTHLDLYIFMHTLSTFSCLLLNTNTVRNNFSINFSFITCLENEWSS